jgi:serine/threonine-protein phosphatase 2B catalytic subunit
VQCEGFKMHKWGSKDSFPYVITLFSAPNYCGSYNNKAAVLILKNNNLQLKQYQETDAPYRLPDGLDLISWSMPFLAEKITSMLYHVLKQCTPAELLSSDGTVSEKLESAVDLQNEKLARKARLRQKILALGRMNGMLGLLKNNSEAIL